MTLIFNGKNRVTSGYRLSDRPDHNGIDIVGDDDREILCPVDGVVRSSTIITDKSNKTWEWGNYVRVDDKDGNRLYFCHMDKRYVIAGQNVHKGDVLGEMGNTGYSFGAHTHFEVRKSDGKTNIDPAKYLGIPNAKGTYTNHAPKWEKTPRGWRYGTIANAWKLINERWYWFDVDGYAVTGMRTIGGRLYYFATAEDAADSVNKIKECQLVMTSDSGAII